MTQNVVTPSTPSTPSGTGSAWPDQPRPETPSPPLGGGLRDGVEAAGPLELPTPSAGTGLELTPVVPCSGCPDCQATDTPCAHCSSPILAGAPRLSELVFIPNAVFIDEYHPGCWTAEQAAVGPTA